MFYQFAEWVMQLIFVVLAGAVLVFICGFGVYIGAAIFYPDALLPEYDINGCYKTTDMVFSGMAGSTPIYLYQDKIVCDPSKAKR